MSRATTTDFDPYLWHDNHIYGLEFRVGDPEIGDWTCDLVLDIDHIVEWVRTPDGIRFLVAPATLTFHSVTDPRIDIDWGSSGYRVSHDLPSIDHIEREPVADQKVHLDRIYYAWRIVLNAPQGGEIGLGAVEFSQTLRQEPILCEQQRIRRGR